MTDREIVFWETQPDREILRWSSIEEAVEMWADERDDASLPETITVYGYARMELPSVDRLAEDAIEGAIQQVDEELGDPEGTETYTPSDAVRAAAIVLAEAIRADYTPWACEEVERRTVTVRDYLTPRNASLAISESAPHPLPGERRA